MLNVVALHGRLTRPAEARVLPAGTPVVGLELSVRRGESERADSVPVVWYDAPVAPDLDAGDEVVVVGHVARRFFRAGGGTQSRTEVVASSVVPVRGTSKKKARQVLAAAAQAVEDGAVEAVARKPGRAPAGV